MIMAKIIKISELPRANKLSPKMKRIREKLLNGPTMTKGQLRTYDEIDKWMRGWKI
jgi:hypothetical protein